MWGRGEGKRALSAKSGFKLKLLICLPQIS